MNKYEKELYEIMFEFNMTTREEISNENGAPNLLELVEQATPPTEEEVCKALSDYLGCKVSLSINGKRFLYQKKNKYNEEYTTYWIVALYDDKIELPLDRGLPPKLITMIGRFYE